MKFVSNEYFPEKNLVVMEIKEINGKVLNQNQETIRLVANGVKNMKVSRENR